MGPEQQEKTDKNDLPSDMPASANSFLITRYLTEEGNEDRPSLFVIYEGRKCQLSINPRGDVGLISKSPNSAIGPVFLLVQERRAFLTQESATSLNKFLQEQALKKTAYPTATERNYVTDFIEANQRTVKKTINQPRSLLSLPGIQAGLNQLANVIKPKPGALKPQAISNLRYMLLTNHVQAAQAIKAIILEIERQNLQGIYTIPNALAPERLPNFTLYFGTDQRVMDVIMHIAQILNCVAPLRNFVGPLANKKAYLSLVTDGSRTLATWNAAYLCFDK